MIDPQAQPTVAIDQPGHTAMNFDWTNPYPTIRSPLMACNVVATSHPLSSQAWLR